MAEERNPQVQRGGTLLRVLRAKAFEEADADALSEAVTAWLDTLEEERLAAVVPLMTGTPGVLILYTQ